MKINSLSEFASEYAEHNGSKGGGGSLAVGLNGEGSLLGVFGLNKQLFVVVMGNVTFC